MNISQISEILNISSYTLRYYEKLGFIKNIKRDKSGKRDYSEQDLKWIEFLLRLKKIKMPIEKIKMYSDLRYIGDTTVKDRRMMLEDQKKKLLAQIDEIEESIEYLDNKIEIYNRMEDEINEK